MDEGASEKKPDRNHIFSAPAHAFTRLAHWLIRWLSKFPGRSALIKTGDLRSENLLTSVDINGSVIIPFFR